MYTLKKNINITCFVAKFRKARYDNETQNFLYFLRHSWNNKKLNFVVHLLNYFCSTSFFKN